MKYLLAFLPLTGICLSADLPQKDEMEALILSLPPHRFYEESTDSFRQRLRDGEFRVDPQEQTTYLFIEGDGCFGKRLFVLNRNSTLTIFELADDEEGRPTWTVHQYDRIRKKLVLPGEFKHSLFKRPSTRKATY